MRKKVRFLRHTFVLTWRRWFVFCAKPRVTYVHTDHYFPEDNIL